MTSSVRVLLPDKPVESLDAYLAGGGGEALKKALAVLRRSAGYEAPYWQQRFFDHVLRSSESHAQKWRYVKENPVRAGLVTRSEEWPYQGEICAL